MKNAERPVDGSGTSLTGGDRREAPADIAALSFDEALTQLQETVAALEAGGQPLEEALALYERGVALQQHCDRLLAAAELRVRRLVERAGGALEAVEADDEGEPSP